MEDKRTKRMQKILLHITNNYQNTISLGEMAQMVDMDKSSFCIFFRQMTNKTFTAYVNEYRIEAACQIIHSTNPDISEVCYACGFKNVDYFEWVFKKIKGVTPTVYKKQALQKKG